MRLLSRGRQQLSPKRSFSHLCGVIRWLNMLLVSLLQLAETDDKKAAGRGSLVADLELFARCVTFRLPCF